MAASAASGNRSHIPIPIYLDHALIDAIIAGADRAGHPLDVGPEGGPARWWAFHDAASSAGIVSEVKTAAQLKKVVPGQLVEISGTASGNPLLEVLDFVAMMLPLVIEQSTAAAARLPRPSGAKLQRPPTEAEEELELQKLLVGLIGGARDELRRAPVLDVRIDTVGGFPVVATPSLAVLGAEGAERLRSGDYRVVGKVRASFGPTDPVNLFRRSSLGGVGVEASREMLSELAESGMDMAEVDPVVDGPGLELLPVAIII